MDEDAIDLRAILGTLRRHLRLIAAIVVAVLLVAVGVTYSLTPHYTATNLIFVDTAQKNLLEPDPASSTSSATDNARVESEVEIVKSVPTFIRVIEDADLLADPEFMPRLGLRQQLMAWLRLGEPTLPTGEEALNAVVDKLRNSVSVQRRGLTYLIAINATARSPQTAARIANATAEAYIALQIAAKTQSVLVALERLEPRLAEAAASLAKSEAAFDQFIEVNFDRMAAGNNQEVSTLRTQMQSVAALRTRLERQVGIASNSLAVLDYDTLAQSLQSQAVLQLQGQRRQLLTQLEGSTQQDETTASLRETLAALETEIRQAADVQIEALHSQIASIQEESQALRETARQVVFNTNLPPEMLTEIFELQQNASLAQAGYQRLLARVDDLRTQADLQIADSRVAAAATPPSTPSFPNPTLILSLAALVGLSLAVAVAFVVDNFVGGITSQEQLESVTRHEVAASLPLQRPSRRDGALPASSVADSVARAPLSPYPEAVRGLRLRLDQVLDQKDSAGGGKVVLVTSALPVEGKTATALALARTYALSGQSVMLIDADLRKPSLHLHLGVDSTAGLNDYLAGRATEEALKSLLTRDPLSEAWTILNSSRSDVPSEHLITSRNFAALIGAARQNHDIVLIDTAPAGVVVDAAHLLRHTDAVLFVTRYARTRQREVLRALNLLERSNVRGLPLILALTQKPGRLGFYGGKDAYGYYSEA